MDCASIVASKNPPSSGTTRASCSYSSALLIYCVLHSVMNMSVALCFRVLVYRLYSCAELLTSGQERSILSSHFFELAIAVQKDNRFILHIDNHIA